VIKVGSSEITYGSPFVIATNDQPSSAALRVAPSLGERARNAVPSPASDHADRAERLDELASHLELLWRFACRMGIGSSAAEDIAQEAFVVAAARIEDVLPGKERAFLLSVVVHMVRRERIRGARYEELTGEPVASLTDHPDMQIDDERARRLLDLALASLDDELRAVFILHEIEEETMASIAQMLDLPPGTVASRLRRAREEWRRATTRLKNARTGRQP
jgi:RNA polymerase sigma-70 factor (ECF subfamily)